LRGSPVTTAQKVRDLSLASEKTIREKGGFEA
jgi:hypothetical protein